MDVTFLGDIGKAFSIEVGFFDSFLEIKEKIKKSTKVFPLTCKNSFSMANFSKMMTSSSTATSFKALALSSI
jgi:hypothetical protein